MAGDNLLVVAGGTGLVGRYLAAAALAAGHRVRVLSRNAGHPAGLDPRVEVMAWDPGAASRGDERAVKALAAALDGAAWMANLAGAGVADKRLDDLRKAQVLASRVEAAAALHRALDLCKRPPTFWFQASATGFYGDTGEIDVEEATPPGDNFLSDVCVAWEDAAKRRPDGGAPRQRLAIGRIGVVFARDAPAWQKLVKPIRWGAGGRLGSGRQWWGWIDAEDLAKAILFLFEHEEAAGVFNLTAPDPVRQGDLARAIARRIKRPSFIPAPAFVLKLVLGELAELLLLASCKAVPSRLEAAGFKFERGALEQALDHLLG